MPGPGNPIRRFRMSDEEWKVVEEVLEKKDKTLKDYVLETAQADLEKLEEAEWEWDSFGPFDPGYPAHREQEGPPAF